MKASRTVRDTLGGTAALLAPFRVFSLVCALAITLLLGSCGGGIGGTGNGGGDPAPGPGTAPFTYTIQHVPVRFAAAVPATLVDHNESSEQTPQKLISERVHDFVVAKLEIAVLQLYLDASWEQIENYCLSIGNGDFCELQGVPITFEYTSQMAEWEARERAEILEEKNGADVTLSQVELNELAEQMESKVGTQINLDLQSVSFNPESELAFTVKLNGSSTLSADNNYEVRWTQSQDKVQVIITASDPQSTRYQKSMYYLPAETQAELQQVVSDNGMLDSQEIVQFDLKSVPGSEKKHLESSVTTNTNGTSTDVYTLGQVDDQGGFLYSESTVIEQNQPPQSTFQREHFDSQNEEYSYSECTVEMSEACGEDGSWSLISGSDPVDLTYYVEPVELEAVNDELKPFTVSIRNVSETALFYYLISSENLSFTHTEQGIAVQLTGFPPFLWTPTGELQVIGDEEPDLTNVNAVVPEFLCWVVNTNSEISSRAMCTGTPDDVRTALVVSVSYSELGEFVVNWESAAIVEVIE